jgi:hypothetical protein
MRFHGNHPEYGFQRIRLSRGKHCLAAQVYHGGVDTRLLASMSPFWWCRVVRAEENDEPILLQWRCHELEGYETVRRVNPQLGWIEWCDTRQQPQNWQSNDFDDALWALPVATVVPGGEPQRAHLDGVKQFEYSLQPIDSGVFVETFGYETDDPAARFFCATCSRTIRYRAAKSKARICKACGAVTI